MTSELQRLLNKAILGNRKPLKVDGIMGAKTRAELRLFQANEGLPITGVPDTETWVALKAWDNSPPRLSLVDIKEAAHILAVPLSATRAVISVESRGAGFNSDDSCSILFERHIMRRQLIARKIKPEGPPNIVNSKPGGYKGGIAEWSRIREAIKINEDAALSSASWGLFQIMGFHWRRLGYGSPVEYAELMGVSEFEHLKAFVRFIRTDPELHQAMQQKDWHTFSRIYNGRNYAAHGYHTRLAAADKRYS